MDTSFETIRTPYKVGLNIPPKEGDIAIVSTDHAGRPGQLNQFVLREFGYNEKNLPKQNELVRGCSLITEAGKKAILFVVTVNEGRTSENLAKNLYNALVGFRELFKKKALWIPLMGTGSGGLTLQESYFITVKTINEFQKKNSTETTILLSIPDNPEGQELYQNINSQSTTNKPASDDAASFIKNLDATFYLVGAYWSGGDLTNRFIKEGIWVNGYDDGNYSKLINSIKVNDILIIKSTFHSNGISYLRVKAFGIVTENKQDGVTLKVNWRITGLWEDIESLGFFRNTIHKVSPDYASIILSKLDRNRWNDLRSITKKETIAGLISDSDKGVDYLEITKDVNAFAKVVSARSFVPPLAIALFGKWGSGKSFFMRKLKEQIEWLSKNNSGSGIYCDGIAHIHFNAWSYMDSNLWASIVTKIFEELNEYISENTKGKIEKRKIEKQLTGQLSIMKEEIGILENKKNSIEGQIENLQKKEEIISKELKEKIEEVKTDTVWKIIKKVDDEFDTKEEISKVFKENESYLETEDELKKIIPEKYWNNPEKTYQLAKSRITFLREFFRKGNILTNLIWFLPILLTILFLPLILELLSVQISKTNFLIPQTVLSLLFTGGVIWQKAKTVYNQFQPIVSSFWRIKEDYEKKMKEEVSKFEQKEKALKLEIEKGQSEILLILEQIQKAESIKTDLEFRINNALTTETLYSFIDRRSKSDDYKKHLGIISTIRKDFEILNSLFIGHNQEVENAEKFKQYFKTPLERIILYIDDLDRCPEENVVQVLEAVNLLMAFPLFVVIVGVDSRWVKNALIKKHALQFAGKLNGNDTVNSDLEIIGPSNYLEKIFQVPFHVKDAEDTAVKGMIKKLAQSKAQIPGGASESESAEFKTVTSGGIEKPQKGDNTEIEVEEPISNPDKTTGIIRIDKPEALILTDDEIALMQDMSKVLGNNPRVIKRFVNIFRIIKAHEEFIYSSDTNNQELTAILFLLALPLGEYKKLLPSFEEFIQNKDNSTEQLALYLQPTHKVEGLDDLKHKLDVTLSDNQSFRVLQNISVGILRAHNSFIRRFTFRQL